MRTTFLLSALLFTGVLYAQQNVSGKPAYVIIINGEIVSKEKMNDYARRGSIKQMTKGVSAPEREKLAEKLGERVGEKEFIVLISLYTEEEMRQREMSQNAKEVAGDSLKRTATLSGMVTNEMAKDFTAQMVDGTTVQLSALKGKVVLVNFWATWCAPCLMEFYDIPSKILQPFKNADFVFLAISRGESKEKVVARMERLKKDGIHFTAAIDPDETISKLYDAEPIPKNFVIDKNGVIRYIATGNAEGNLEKLAQEIRKLLN